MDNTARVTIQMMHRVGALVTVLFVGGLALWMILTVKVKRLRTLAILIFDLLIIQSIIGIFNVMWLLPLTLALAHTAVAALLLLALVSLNVKVFASRSTDEHSRQPNPVHERHS